MAALPVFRINTNANIQRAAISEDHDCVVIDDFLQDPHEIVEFAHLPEVERVESHDPSHG